MKLSYMYSVIKEEEVDNNSNDFADTSDSDTITEDLVVDSVPVGNRIVDMTIFSNNIAPSGGFCASRKQNC